MGAIPIQTTIPSNLCSLEVARKLRLDLTVSPSCPQIHDPFAFSFQVLRLEHVHYIPVPCGVCCCLFVWYKVSLCNPGWPRVGFIDYTGLEFSVVLVFCSSKCWDYNRHTPPFLWLFLFVCYIWGVGETRQVWFLSRIRKLVCPPATFPIIQLG